MDHYNRHAKERDELQELQGVWFKKEPTANWKPATVIERPSDSPRAYIVQDDAGTCFQRTAMTRTPSFLGEKNAMKLIPNELLCYAFNYADNSTVSSLSACLCEFYQPQEISSAHEILWKKYEQVISTLTKKTRRSQAPTDAVSAKPFAEDIGVWINHVKNNTSASIMTTFCAVNIRKIPNCPLEEINLFSIVARLGAIEKKLEDSEPTVHKVQKREDIAAPLALVADDQLQTAVNEPPQKTSGVRPLVAQAEWTSVVKKRMNKKKKIRIAAKELTTV
ncbi:hypothetical protein CAPTEDRAFT_191106, partial [Capitella teleta]